MSVRIQKVLRGVLPRNMKRGVKKRLANFVVRFHKGEEEFTEKELLEVMDTLSYSTHRTVRQKDGTIVFTTVNGEPITGYLAKVLGWYDAVTKGKKELGRKKRPSGALLRTAKLQVKYDLDELGVQMDPEAIDRIVTAFTVGDNYPLRAQDKNSLVKASWRLGVRSGFCYFYDPYLRMLSEPLQEVLEEILTEAVCG